MLPFVIFKSNLHSWIKYTFWINCKKLAFMNELIVRKKQYIQISSASSLLWLTECRSVNLPIICYIDTPLINRKFFWIKESHHVYKFANITLLSYIAIWSFKMCMLIFFKFLVSDYNYYWLHYWFLTCSNQILQYYKSTSRHVSSKYKLNTNIIQIDILIERDSHM